MRRALAAAAVVIGAGAAVAGSFSGGFTFGDDGGLAGIGLGDGTTTAAASTTPATSFDLIAGATTPNDLPDSLTVNSTSLTLVLACDAQGVSGTNWTCRDGSGAVVLSETGAGSSPTTSILTPFHALDSAERGVAYATTGKTHSATTSSVADFTTEDLVVEYVGKLGSANVVVLDKGLSGTDGWSLSGGSTTTPRLNLRTGSVTTAIVAPSASNVAFAHLMFFADRNEASTNGSFAYLNGSPGSGSDVSARAGSLSNTSLFASGGNSGSSNIGTATSLRVWKCTACFAGGATNPAQWAPIARQRAAIAFGIAPSIAVGTAAPTALTRATSAHVDVVDGSTRHLYLTSNGAPRIARRSYSGGTLVAGYMSEPAASNIALQSQTLGTTWAAITVGDNVLADAWAGADLTTTGDDVDGNNSAAEHGLRQSITVTAATHTFSAWAKAGSQTFVALRDNTIVSGAAWFDLTACAACTIGEDCTAAVKTVQAGVIQARAQRWPVDNTGDGVADVNLCRVSIAYTGTAAAHDHDLLCAPSDGVTSYTDADATADCGFWGVRVEAFPTMTSYLATTTASVARNADDVRFDGTSHFVGSPTTMDVGVLCPSHDTDTSRIFASIGTAGTNYAGLRVASTDFPEALGVVSSVQWQITGASGDVSNGVVHNLRQTMATNSIEAFYDTVSIGTDTLATLPTEVGSSIFIGTQGGTAAQTACLLSRLRLWPSVVTPAVVP